MGRGRGNEARRAAPDHDEAAEQRGRDVVGVEAADGGLARQPGRHERGLGQRRAEQRIDRQRGRRRARRAAAQAAAERQALRGPRARARPGGARASALSSGRPGPAPAVAALLTGPLRGGAPCTARHLGLEPAASLPCPRTRLLRLAALLRKPQPVGRPWPSSCGAGPGITSGACIHCWRARSPLQSQTAPWRSTARAAPERALCRRMPTPQRGRSAPNSFKVSRAAMPAQFSAATSDSRPPSPSMASISTSPGRSGSARAVTVSPSPCRCEPEAAR